MSMDVSTWAQKAEKALCQPPLCDLAGHRQRLCLLADLTQSLGRLRSESRLTRVALLGAVSSGKSSFINTLLGKNIAVVDGPATTRCRTDFVYSSNLDKDGYRIIDASTMSSVDISEYHHRSIDKKAPSSAHYIVELDNRRLEGMCLIDTPGFNSAKEERGETQEDDYAISRRCADDADVILFLIGADKGTTSQEVIEYLKELSPRMEENSEDRVTLHLIMNKANSKPPSGRRIAQEEILNQCSRHSLPITEVLIHSSQRKSEKKEDFDAMQEHMWQLLETAKENLQKTKKRALDIVRTRRTALCRSVLKDIDATLNSINLQIKRAVKKIERNTYYDTENLVYHIRNLSACAIKQSIAENSSCHIVENSGFLFDFTRDWQYVLTKPDKDVLQASFSGYQEHLQQYLVDTFDFKEKEASSWASRIVNRMAVFLSEEIQDEKNDVSNEKKALSMAKDREEYYLESLLPKLAEILADLCSECMEGHYSVLLETELKEPNERKQTYEELRQFFMLPVMM